MGKLHSKRKNHFESRINKGSKRKHRICYDPRDVSFGTLWSHKKILRASEKGNAGLGEVENEVGKNSIVIPTEKQTKA